MQKLFTTAEWNIINHRLEVPDAIVQVLIDDDLVDQDLCWEDAIEEINSLQVAGNEISNWDRLSKLQQLAIIEAVEGSTYLDNLMDAVGDGALPRQTYTAAQGTMNRLQAKLAQLDK